MPDMIIQVETGYAIPLHSRQSKTMNQETEILSGETYEVIDHDYPWVRVRTRLDRYEGFILYDHQRDRASDSIVDMNHVVDVARANVYAEPDFKSVVTKQLPFNASVHTSLVVETAVGMMAEIAPNAWVFVDQLRYPRSYWSDFVDACLVLNGQPYVWGGRGTFGWDCSSAIQAGCIAAGVPFCERDAGPQSRTLGHKLDLEQALTVPQRGDLFYWTELKGRHVVVMVDHQNAFHFSIENRVGMVESLDHIIEVQERNGNGRPTVARRLTNE